MDRPQIRIVSGPEELAQAAAERFAALGTEAVARRGRFLVALAGGTTPQALYRLLAEPAQRLPERIWRATHVFWGDERCVPPDDPESNFGQAQAALLAHVPIPPENVHRIRGELQPAAAAADYAGQLSWAGRPLPWPAFDLVLLGLGADGHTASLFPGPIPPAERESPAMAVTALYEGRPAQRVTLTPAVFSTARAVIFLVTGAGKSEAVAAALASPLDPERCPAQRIRPEHGTLVWLLDEAAASRLPESVLSTR